MTTRDDLVSRWSCDEKRTGKNWNCRNPFGCHCREITAHRNALEAKDAEIARLTADIETMNLNHRQMAKQMADLGRLLAIETERCARVAVDRSERERSFQVAYMKNEKPAQSAEHCYGRVVADNIAAAIRGGAKP